MANFTPLLQSMKEMESYSEKTQFASYILTGLQRKSIKLTKQDKVELMDFIFCEIEKLIELIPSLDSYKEKDTLFEYEDNLMGIVMLCHASPAELPEDRLYRLKTLAKIVDKERVVENALSDIFEQVKTDKEDVEALLTLLKAVKDEYQKGQLYQGLAHYEQNINKLPENSKALFSEYIASEIKRYLRSPLNEDIINNLEFACDVCKYFISDTLLSLLFEALKLGKSNVSFYAVQTLLTFSKDIPDEVIAALANDLGYACLLYEALKTHRQAHRFPAELAKPEYLAKSDMVRWLLYPTELGKEPDEIELLGKVKKKEEFYIFRFRSDSDNLGEEIKGKWLIGWSSENGGTFSNFDLYEAFEQKTLEKTLNHIKKKLL